MPSLSAPSSIPTLLISANFTAEPVEDSLVFWMNELAIPYQVKFTPYNQIFQHLLDPTSIVSNNQNGFNVLLICLEDWIGTGRLPVDNGTPEANTVEALSLSSQASTSIPSQMSRHRLSNGMTIAHQNDYETEYLFTEIFQDQAYLKHGITIKEDDCIVDIGANIGMFTLFAQQLANRGKIYAIEPSPPVFETLRVNANLYGDNVKVFNCGISSENKTATFTYYPHSSVFSGFAADKEADETVLRAIIQNQQQEAGGDLQVDHMNSLMQNGRMDSVQYTCQLRSLSEIIQAEQIEKIDLLKLDAEKSELDVLRGIRVDDWPKIRQIVMEAHENAEKTVLTQITEILVEHGFEVHVDQESLLAQTTFYNIYAKRPTPDAPNSTQNVQLEEMHGRLQRNLADLVEALGDASQRTSVPTLLCLCPAAPSTMAKSGMAALIDKTESLLTAQLASMKNVALLTSTDLRQQYEAPGYFDAYSYKTGHVPYTSTMFAAIGSAIMRKYRAMQAKPYKVIVLDCDQTLWHGVCAEDGVQGISMTPPFQYLQEFMVQQAESGMLLCLCSKNQEADVLAVLEQRTDMPLRQEQLIAWRINWSPKSENLKSLAEELQLGLDSFIFIDDNPLECAEVRAACPEVLTLQLPSDRDQIQDFLHHIWAFDRIQITQEDRNRTILYQQNAERERLRQTAPTLQNFLDGLNLQVQIAPMTSVQTARVSQLTQRTNQFNLTTIRRSEADIEQLLGSPMHTCLTVTVSDRFGDYGLVGVIIYAKSKNTIDIDTFLLSCRALGRHVEHKMLVNLAAIATRHDINKIILPYVETPRNQPAFEFLEQVAAEFKSHNGQDISYVLPVHKAASALEQAVAGASSTAELANPLRKVGEVDPSTSDGFANSALFQKIATDLNSAEKVVSALKLQTRPRPLMTQAYAPPQSEVERKVAGIWQDVLHLERVGVNDNFTELGGGSLQVVQIHSRLTQSLKVNLPITQLFSLPTVRTIVQYLDKEQNASGTAATIVQDRASKQRSAMNRNKLARNRIR